jgi:hypothetical protein
LLHVQPSLRPASGAGQAGFREDLLLFVNCKAAWGSGMPSKTETLLALALAMSLEKARPKRKPRR